MIRGTRQRGFALLIVLWTLVLIALLVTQLTASGRRETQLALNLRTGATLQAMADGEVHEAIFHLMDTPSARWVADGITRTISLPGATAAISITNEAGLINPSTATPELLQALMRVLGTPSGTAAEVAREIVVWRTPSGVSDITAARFDAYRASGREYGPSGAPFVSMEELGAVVGMTPELLSRMTPHLSLYTEGDPDPNAADPIIREALAGAPIGNFSAPSTDQSQVRILGIDVTVSGPYGTQSMRHAVVRLQDNGQEQDYRILAWGGPSQSGSSKK